MSERIFTPQEVAQMWRLSYGKVLDMFRDEPGVMVIANSSKRKRVYRTIRIPESVEQRVKRRISNV